MRNIHISIGCAVTKHCGLGVRILKCSRRSMKSVDLKLKYRARRQAAHYAALQGYRVVRKILQNLNTQIENIRYTVSTVLNHARQKRRIRAFIALHGDAR